MDDIEKRLRDVSDNCINAYLQWNKAKRDAESREDLQDAIHELRKVSARLEIEIAASERDEMAMRPIPVPPHRATRKRQAEDDDNGDNTGNSNVGEGSSNAPRQAAPRHVLRRRSQSTSGQASGTKAPKGDEE